MSHTPESLEQGEQANQPRLCSNGCGFFANQPLDMCSKCHRELAATTQQAQAALSTAADVGAKVQQQAAAVSPLPPAQQPAVAVVVPESPAEAAAGQPDASTSGAGDSASATPQKHPNRCFSCNKRVGLTGFKCRCGYVFCGSHRLAEAHSCDFDYKGTGRERLATANPLVKASKLQKL